MGTVRMAAIEDAESIARVHLDGWQWGYAGVLPAPYLTSLAQTLERRVRRHRDHLTDGAAQRPVFVALGADDEVVGFTNVGPYRDTPEESSPGIGEVYAIYVCRGAAGTGAGRALMDAAVGWLRGREFDPIRLWVLEGNARARRFYERYGFRLDGARSTYALQQPGELTLDFPELRYALTGAG